MRILVVEDDLVSRRLLGKILDSWGHEVLTAENGQEAWKILQEENLRFVVADWMMPVMDGVELCRKIRSADISGYVYFILLTGKDRKEDIIEGLDGGADDYVTKPFDRDELKVRIRAGERILKLEKELTEKNTELQCLNNKLEKLARLDPLLDIGNRRNFYENIQKVHHRASRYGHEYGMIMCDVDNFKAYNDMYGHIAGDHVLKATADSLKSSLRTSDDIFRYGGEEVVIVLPEQDLEKTLVVAERLRRDVESLQVEHKGTQRGILTISCGVSTFDKTDKDCKWETVLDRADKALYLAKSAGRNQVCMFNNSK